MAMQPPTRLRPDETPAALCRRMRWDVGTRLRSGAAIIEITALGAAAVLAREEGGAEAPWDPEAGEWQRIKRCKRIIRLHSPSVCDRATGQARTPPVGELRWLEGTGECSFTEVTCDCPRARWSMEFDDLGYDFCNECPETETDGGDSPHEVIFTADWDDRFGLFFDRRAEFARLADEQARQRMEAAR